MKRRLARYLIMILIGSGVVGCATDGAPTPTFVPLTPTATLPPPTVTSLIPTSPPDVSLGTPLYTFRIVNVYPHDRDAFTQGLIFEDGGFYEGTGLWERSTLRRVALETGEVQRMHQLADQYFGEGITVYGDRIIQLTWQSRVGFVYDKDSFELLQEFSYPTEGWGITHDGTRLIMSDGTANLYFWDPQSFKEIGRVQVYDEQGPVVRLNELEYIHGEVYANGLRRGLP